MAKCFLNKYRARQKIFFQNSLGPGYKKSCQDTFIYVISENSHDPKKRALFEFREIRRVASSHQRINLEEISPLLSLGERTGQSRRGVQTGPDDLFLLHAGLNV